MRTIADILLEEALAVVAADHRVRQIQILHDGLELAAMKPRDAATEDEGKFVGLTNGAVGVQESLLEGIDGSATMEDEIVAVLYLRKKQPVLNTGVLSFFGSEKGREAGQPFLRSSDRRR